MTSILIHSNGPHVRSGYGKQALHAGKILRELGHDVAFSCFSGLGGQPIRWEDFTMFPSGVLEFGVDTIASHALTFGADIIIPIMDFWKLAPAAAQLRQIRAERNIRTVGLVINDCVAENGGPGMPDQAALAATGATPAAVSRFGQRCLKAVSADPLYLPHAVDTDVFKPIPQDAARTEFGSPRMDGFVIGIMAANRDLIRKGFIEQLGAFQTFSARHDDARLALFTVPSGPGAQLDLVQVATDFGVLDKCVFMPVYEQVTGLLTDEFTAGWYSSLDVLSMCSYGEGFGVPLIEAQACGTPVVATDCSAMTELALPAGWLVDADRFWNPQHRAWWYRPREASIVDAWEEIYAERGDSSQAAMRVAQGYSVGNTVPYWEKLIAKMTDGDC